MFAFLKYGSVAAIAFLIFILGGIFAANNLQPVKLYIRAYEFFLTTDIHGKTPRQKIENALDITPYDHVWVSDYEPAEPARYKKVAIEGLRARRQAPLVFIDREKRQPGLTVINGTLDRRDGMHGIVLLDEAGDVRHVWPIDQRYAPWVEGLGGRIAPHAMHVFRDGSVIVVNDFGEAVARVDACGDPLWVQPVTPHHSIAPAADNSFWTWDGKRMIRIAGDSGDILQSIHLHDVYEANPHIDLYGVIQTDYEGESKWRPDAMHANDVEPLPAEMADAFPMFDAGDLVVSMRSLNLLSVLDPDTLEIKWWRFGVGRRQHDPDWQLDGTILFFDNNTNRGFSRIRKIDPTTLEVSDVISGEPYQFKTTRRGRQFAREDGSILVVSAYQGRVFEVAPDGSIVFEFINVYDAEANLYGRVGDAIILPSSYFEEMPRCESSR